MALVTMKEIFLPARKEKRAVGAFNIANYETARAVIQAAEAEKSPVIIQLYMRLFDSTKAFDLAGSLIRMAHRCNQPVALHLDHGDNVGQVKDALAWGYTSVMYDGSRLPFEENVRITHFCVEYAKAFGASVEDSLWRLRRRRLVVRDAEYGADITLRVAFPAGTAETFQLRLTELSAGSLTMTAAGEEFLPGPREEAN